LDYHETYVGLGFVIPIHTSANAETLVNIGPVVGKIFGEIGLFLPSHPKGAFITLVITRVTGPIFVIFEQNVDNCHQIFFESVWRYCKLISNAMVPNE